MLYGTAGIKIERGWEHRSVVECVFLACARPCVPAPVPDKLIKQVDSILELTDSRRRNQRELKLKKDSVCYCCFGYGGDHRRKKAGGLKKLRAGSSSRQLARSWPCFSYFNELASPNNLKGLQIGSSSEPPDRSPAGILIWALQYPEQSPFGPLTYRVLR